jgi:hypothetical protein
MMGETGSGMESGVLAMPTRWSKEPIELMGLTGSSGRRWLSWNGLGCRLELVPGLW